ncbi:hypothetical protein L21SP5_03441 [Salinivirga cyanobacteriivorans]|uniref:CRISPR-associated protein Csh1 n=1 Tax=Salinivirga cyanobacteriivorans TaxID=1307839 RepID=A0A0S2I549_9BACT|nr:hypothetical protein [Salinivirga cyanobacteriivorans]ALO17052.1 hypothetical protein L21SP5_03441 [Salinivirga cyanobacteriivorans]
MITELTNFVDTIPQEIFAKYLKPKEGLYILLEIDKNGNLINANEDGSIKEEDVGKYSEKDEKENGLKEHMKKCKTLFLNSKVFGKGTNKSFNSSSGLFSTTATPFGIGFTKKNYTNPDRDRSKDYINNQIEAYFKSAESFLGDNKKYAEWMNKFKLFLISNLFDYINKHDILSDVKQTENVCFFLKDPTSEDYKTVNQLYISDKIFNETYKTETNEVGIYAVTHNFNDNKSFLKHKTGISESAKWIVGETAAKLDKFYSIQKYLPNPFPLFIYKDELDEFNKAFKVFKSDEKIKYSEIVKTILDDKRESLHNFYLLFFKGTDYSRVVDIDFIPMFKYKIDLTIKSLFYINENEKFDKKLNSVFQFEQKVLKEVLNIHTDYSIDYFGDVKFNSQYQTHNDYTQLLKYRKAFYDYIYKSRKEAITQQMFDDILLKGILDDIRHDEYDAKGNYHSKSKPILNKLNIWFSLYNYFNNSNKKENMITKIENHRNVIDTIISDKTKLINTDDEFAYASGHCIRYLFTKSETKDKSYNRLETFLQKTDCRIFQKALANFFAMYKHKNMTDKFGRVFSQVMDYETEANIKDFLPEFLAGFFDHNKLFSETEKKENETKINEPENNVN